MEATARAVVRLTEHHTEMTEAGAVEWPPLLVWLQTRVTEIVGRKGGSSAGAGVPLNTEALEVLGYIERRYRLMCEAAFIAPIHNLPAGVARVWEILKDDRAGGRMDDGQWERITHEFTDWVARIEAEDDRPRKLELTVPCPRCEKRWTLDEQGQRIAAITVVFSPGRAPVAECRVEDCGAMWAGWSEVARLGFTVGAEQDAVVLAACGIDTPMFGS